jgi:hypothetical protein
MLSCGRRRRSPRAGVAPVASAIRSRRTRPLQSSTRVHPRLSAACSDPGSPTREAGSRSDRWLRSCPRADLQPLVHARPPAPAHLNTRALLGWSTRRRGAAFLVQTRRRAWRSGRARRVAAAAAGRRTEPSAHLASGLAEPRTRPRRVRISHMLCQDQPGSGGLPCLAVAGRRAGVSGQDALKGSLQEPELAVAWRNADCLGQHGGAADPGPYLAQAPPELRAWEVRARPTPRSCSPWGLPLRLTTMPPSSTHLGLLRRSRGREPAPGVGTVLSRCISSRTETLPSCAFP